MTTTFLSNGKTHFGETLHLHFSCKNLKNMDLISKSDPQIILKLLSTGETYKTEIQFDNLNPKFHKYIPIVYIFEKKQEIEIEVRDIDNEQNNQYEIIGTVRVTLGKVVGGWKNPFSIEIRDFNKQVTGTVEIYFEKVAETNEIWTFQPKVENVFNNRWFSKPNCFLSFYKPMVGEGKDVNVDTCNNWAKFFETDVVQASLDPLFREVELSSFLMCRNDYDLPIKVTYFVLNLG